MEEQCIILGDSHQTVLEGIRSLVEPYYESVVMVANKTSLRNVLEKMTPNLLIVDLSLLSQGKEDPLGDLRCLLFQIPCIILSVYDEPEIVEYVLASGAAGYVLKQHAGTDLYPAIESIRQKKPFIFPAVKKGKFKRE